MNTLQRIVWLASFPKSGNTWTRSFLANYFQPPGRTLDINSLRQFTTADIRSDFFDRAAGGRYTGETIDDWLAVRPKALRLIAESKPGHHFVKTHCQIRRIGGVDLIPPDVTAAAVYIMRNPFDLALSFSRHLSIDVDATIGRMTDPDAVQANPRKVMEVIGRWDHHIASWTSAPGLPLHVMRYEDMLADTEKAYRNLFGFLKLPVDTAQLRRALEATSFKALQQQEKKFGFRERPAGMSQFFATGKAGGWRAALSPDQVGRLRTEFMPVLEKWYPEMLDETAALAASAGAGR